MLKATRKLIKILPEKLDLTIDATALPNHGLAYCLQTGVNNISTFQLQWCRLPMKGLLAVPLRLGSART